MDRTPLKTTVQVLVVIVLLAILAMSQVNPVMNMGKSVMSLSNTKVTHSMMDHHANPKENSDEEMECHETCTESTEHCCSLAARRMKRMNEKWLTEACSVHPELTACFMRNQCQASGMMNSGLCQPVLLIQVSCEIDGNIMATDPMCTRYKNECGSTEKKAWCEEELFTELLIHIPSEGTSSAAVLSLCSEMRMDGCENCHSKSHCPQPQNLLINLCSQMRMTQCEILDNLCAAISKTHISYQENMEILFGCASVEEAPAMKMYFHGGINEHVLFFNLVPRSTIQYVLICMAIILAGFCSTFLKFARQGNEREWQLHPITISELDAGYTRTGALPLLLGYWCGSYQQRTLVQRNFLRMVFTLVITTIDYSLMLIAMTFNTGFFLSVLLSFGLNQLLFGHWFQHDVQKHHSNHHQSATTSP